MPSFSSRLLQAAGHVLAYLQRFELRAVADLREQQRRCLVNDACKLDAPFSLPGPGQALSPRLDQQAPAICRLQLHFVELVRAAIVG